MNRKTEGKKLWQFCNRRKIWNTSPARNWQTSWTLCWIVCSGKNIGLVITDEGKDDLVLCPSFWLDPFHTEDFGSVINCALRYAMHAEDKESEAAIRYLRHCCGILDEKTLSVAVADLDKELKQPSPSLKNPQVWQELQGMFRKQMAELREAPLENAEQQDPLAKDDEP